MFETVTIKEIQETLGVSRSWVITHFRNPDSPWYVEPFNGKTEKHELLFPVQDLRKKIVELAKCYRQSVVVDLLDWSDDQQATMELYGQMQKARYRKNENAQLLFLELTHTLSGEIDDAIFSGYYSRRRPEPVEVPLPSFIRNDVLSPEETLWMSIKDLTGGLSLELGYRTVYSSALWILSLDGRTYYFFDASEHGGKCPWVLPAKCLPKKLLR